MKKILIGGSPCTRWSIAQKKDRETEAEGLGWELFENYLIAKKKFQPDYFLYENNKSAAQPIKNQISKELGVPLQYINSSLVSAQNRQRFYAHNIPNVEQPEDRGILLKDILEGGIIDREKAYCLKHQAGNARDYIKKSHTQVAFEPVALNTTNNEKSQTIKSQYYKNSIANVFYTSTYGATMVADPVRIGDIGSNSQAHRVYSAYGKSINLVANGGGQGAKTGLYATPIKLGEIGNGGQGNRIYSVEGKSVAQTASSGGIGSNTGLYAEPMIVNLSDYNNVVMLDNGNIEIDGKLIYCVKDKQIPYKDKLYQINLPDGYYIIRKLTPVECERLQTLPDNYTEGISDTQRYKCIGNGWTASVIIHILSHLNIPKDEEIVILSMYDGIATGRYCFDKLGYTNIKYFAYEIDKYAMQVAQKNYPDIIQCGDAFQVREDDWKLE
jgi:DNA (cytosine-5)-methyltransferase 3A